mgnify:CR=1 FL=1
MCIRDRLNPGGRALNFLALGGGSCGDRTVPGAGPTRGVAVEGRDFLGGIRGSGFHVDGLALGFEGIAEAGEGEKGEVCCADVLERLKRIGKALNQVADTGGAGGNEDDIGKRAHHDDEPDVIAADAVFQQHRILGADGHDEG